MNQAPDPHEYAARLGPLSDLVARVLVKANGRARHFFDRDALPHEPFTFTTLHRYHAKLLLCAQYVVTEECEVSIEPKNVPNIGLQLVHDSISCRILKADNGSLPPPRTEARIAYYCQQLAFELDDDGAPSQTEGNVTYLWEDDPEDHRLSHLWLVWPKSASKGQVEEGWRVEIRLPPEEAGEYALLPTRTPRPDLPIALPHEDVETSPGN
jgi:hypothetical protein